MDKFKQSAENLSIINTLSIGATFGIFLTLGRAWSEFIQTVVTAILPKNDGEGTVINATVYAISTSIICLLSICLLVKCEMYCRKLSFKKTIGNINLNKKIHINTISHPIRKLKLRIPN